MKETKTSQDTADKYKDYTLALAVFDGVPVLLFLINGLLIHKRYRSKLFLGGVLCAFLGGASKAAWKVIIVKEKKDIELLTKSFKTLLPAGMSVMMVSGGTGIASAAGKGALKDMSSIVFAQSARWFVLGAAGMGLMGYLGKHMDNSARSNWIEELTNAASQAAFMAGLFM